MSKISSNFLQAIVFEIQLMKKALAEKQGLSDYYEELYRIIKARSKKITQE
jgi:hypothetical protein